MMRLEEAVSGYLQPRLSGALYPFLLPQNCTLPAVAYFPVSVERAHSFIQDTGFVKQRMQFSCFAKSYKAATAMAKVIQEALQNFSGVLGGLAIGGVLIESESADHESDTGIYSVVLEFEFQFKEV